MHSPAKYEGRASAFVTGVNAVDSDEDSTGTSGAERVATAGTFTRDGAKEAFPAGAADLTLVPAAPRPAAALR